MQEPCALPAKQRFELHHDRRSPLFHLRFYRRRIDEEIDDGENLKEEEGVGEIIVRLNVRRRLILMRLFIRRSNEIDRCAQIAKNVLQFRFRDTVGRRHRGNPAGLARIQKDQTGFQYRSQFVMVLIEWTLSNHERQRRGMKHQRTQKIRLF